MKTVAHSTRKRRPRLAPNTRASLDFLGYTFRCDRDLFGRRQWYSNVFPSKRAQQRKRAVLHRMTDRRHCFKLLPCVCLRRPLSESRMRKSARPVGGGESELQSSELSFTLPLYSRSKRGGSFIAEGYHRIDLCRAARREQPGGRGRGEQRQRSP